MNLKYFLVIFLAFSLILTNPVRASYVAVQTPPEKSDQIEAKKLDREARILNAYLAKYNSPMQYHTQDFVDAAKEYNLDWKLLPSIAGVESTFGKNIPGGYNAYGWGIYGSNRLYFKSWRDGMFTVAKGLRENYVNKGLNNPYQMNRVYAASEAWGGKVTYFMNDLEKFAAQYEADYGPVVDLYQPIIKIAVISGQVNPD
jgi:hypothetical protein